LKGIASPIKDKDSTGKNKMGRRIKVILEAIAERDSLEV
jgi:hypothetical protein